MEQAGDSSDSCTVTPACYYFATFFKYMNDHLLKIQEDSDDTAGRL